MPLLAQSRPSFSIVRYMAIAVENIAIRHFGKKNKTKAAPLVTNIHFC
jgi:hypothetical protein